MHPSIYSPEEDSYLLAESLSNLFPEYLLKNPKAKFFEIGPGSGIQLVLLNKCGVKKKNIFSADINPEAVKHCRKLGFDSVKSNLFDKIKGKYDLIIFNPPYLPEDKNYSEPEESKIATTGGKKGSEIINEFLRQSKNHLSKNGKIFLLTSSLTKGIKWQGFKKKFINKKKIFFEELYVYELNLVTSE